MAWIESHQKLKTDPKLKRFQRALGVTRPAAIGMLHELWWYALDHAESGDISLIDRRDLAQELDWPEDRAEELWTALTAQGPDKSSGFVEADGKIHKWSRYAGRLMGDRDRKRRQRERGRELRDAGRDGHGTVTGQSALDRTVPTLPDQPDPTKERSSAPKRAFSPPSLEEVRAYCSERKNGVDPQKWIDHYTSNGWKVGLNPMKNWQAAVRTWERRAGDFNGAASDGGRAGTLKLAAASGKYNGVGEHHDVS